MDLLFGLQTAALIGARYDAGMQYAAEVGVNAYVRVKLSFLQKEVRDIGQVVSQ